MAKKIDLQKHTLIPKHSKLSEKEAKEFLNKYNISTLQLPRILIKDPLVKQLDAKVGDILKIERESRTGKNVYYRVVVNHA